MNFFDYIYLFKETKREFFKDKDLAKSRINWLKHKISYFKDVSGTLHEMSKFIIYNPGIFPRPMKKEIRAVEDLLSWGVNGNKANPSLKELIDNYVIPTTERCYNNAKESFGYRNFDNVQKTCDEFIKILGQYDDSYGTLLVMTVGQYPGQKIDLK